MASKLYRGLVVQAQAVKDDAIKRGADALAAMRSFVGMVPDRLT